MTSVGNDAGGVRERAQEAGGVLRPPQERLAIRSFSPDERTRDHASPALSVSARRREWALRAAQWTMVRVQCSSSCKPRSSSILWMNVTVCEMESFEMFISCKSSAVQEHVFSPVAFAFSFCGWSDGGRRAEISADAMRCDAMRCEGMWGPWRAGPT
jgi:hypothetical protein